MKFSALATAWAATALCLLTLLLSVNSLQAQDEKQILIKSKFIEVSEETAEELGFDWLLGPSGGATDSRRVFGSGGTAGSVKKDGDGESFPFVPPSTTYRFEIDQSTSTGSVETPGPSLFGVAGVFTDPQFQVIIRALNQKKGVDLLSAPSVVTTDGQRAKIEVIREFIYPTEYDPPEIPQSFAPITFFNSGETQFNIGVGGAMGNLSNVTTTTTTVQGVQQVEQTVVQQVQVGQQVQNNQIVPIFQDQEFTFIQEIPFEQEIEKQRIDGIMDEDSAKLALGFTHFLTNNLGVGGQFEWIQGNLGDGYLGLAEVTWREPIDFEKFGLAPYLAGGIGGIYGDGISEVVGSVTGGLELRLQDDVGVYTEYSHNFLGNGMDFGQVLAGINVVIGEKGISSRPPSGGGGGSYSVTPANPSAFETKNVGVTLEVEPIVGPDGKTIELNLAPEVVEFEGFINYGSPITTGGVDASGNPIQVVLTENRIEQPVFSTRKLNTTVTIQDGQIVALGGLIREDVQTVEDKVPFFGDIPLIGRLFRSQQEKHFKRNLMIFVTARLIGPDGNPVNDD